MELLEPLISFCIEYKYIADQFPESSEHQSMLENAYKALDKVVKEMNDVMSGNPVVESLLKNGNDINIKFSKEHLEQTVKDLDKAVKFFVKKMIELVYGVAQRKTTKAKP